MSAEHVEDVAWRTLPQASAEVGEGQRRLGVATSLPVTQRSGPPENALQRGPEVSDDLAAPNSTACPVFEVGPIANHLTGLTAAVRPDFVDETSPDQQVPLKADVDDLIREVCGMDRHDLIHDYGCGSPSLLLVTLPQVSEGAVNRPQQSHIEAARKVDEAIRSGDPDKALPELDGRVAALVAVCDRARFMTGGELSDEVREAVEVLVASLIGPSRWSVLAGWQKALEACRWPWSWGWSPAATRVDNFLRDEQVAAVILRRMLKDRDVEGRRPRFRGPGERLSASPNRRSSRESL